MPMSKDKQLAKIARAKVLAESNPLIPTLTACCAEAGFKVTDRAAISNKDAINEIRFIFDQRKMVRDKTLSFVLSTELASATARNLGWQFREIKHINAKRARITEQSKPQQQCLDAFSSIISSTSSSSMAPSSDVLRWFAHMTAHAAYDLQDAAGFAQTCVEIKEQICGDDVLLLRLVDAHIEWLERKRHCRYTWDRSDMSQRVIKSLQEIGQTDDAVVFVTLLYFGRNSRTALASWRSCCSKREGDLCQTIWDVLGDS